MKINSITPDENGWRTLPNGNHVHLGNDVTLGTGGRLGDRVVVGKGKQMYGLYQDGKGLIEIDSRQNWIQARFDELVMRFQGQSHPYWIEQC